MVFFAGEKLQKEFASFFPVYSHFDIFFFGGFSFEAGAHDDVGNDFVAFGGVGAGFWFQHGAGGIFYIGVRRGWFGYNLFRGGGIGSCFLRGGCAGGEQGH